MLSLIGSILGFGTSFLPKILGYFEEKRDQAHELAIMDKQIKAQEYAASQKLQMINVESNIREIEALHNEHSKSTTKASKWVINLNATVRPMLTYFFFIEFVVLTAAVFANLIDQDQYKMIWNDPTQALWASIASFWFGSRSFNRKNHS